MKRVAASFLLATLALTGTELACADAPINVAVNYADVDLSTAAGAKVVYGRLHAASETVCKPLYRESGNQALRNRYEACIQTAMSDAVKSVGSPRLTEYFAERTGGMPAVTVALAK
jgi:UrcA family protein